MLLSVNPLATSYANRFGALAEQAAGTDAGRKRVALEGLEQYFIFTLLQEMRKTIPKDEVFGYGFQTQVQEEMLDEALSSEMAATGQFGIAKMIEEQLRVAEMQHELRAQLKSDAPIVREPGGVQEAASIKRSPESADKTHEAGPAPGS